MSDIQEEQKRLYKRAEEYDKENLQYMSTEEALNQIKQRIMMHELDDTTSNENEREKVILNYINELQDRINKAVRIIKKYGYEKQMEEDYLMNRVNLANYNCLLLDILKGDNK